MTTDTTITSYPTDDDVYLSLATEYTYEPIQDIADERVAQVEKFGDQSHLPDGTALWGDQNFVMARRAQLQTDEAAKDGSLTWAHILTEEYWEALAETDPQKLRAELIQVAAVAVAWVEAIDRRLS